MKLVRKLLAPLLFLGGLSAVTLAAFGLRARLGIELLGGHGRDGLQIAAYLGIAWLLSRITDQVFSRARPRSRPVPRLLSDLLSALFFLTAFVAGALLLTGNSAGSVLAGSGVVLALLGFAIRNVVADTLSGVALGLEAPFRIGDWVDIERLAKGKVIEIGWRTTRLMTRDSTYVILPNSQISRQRIVNYSAPRSEFRAQLEVTLGYGTTAREAAETLRVALMQTPLIRQTPPPDVRMLAIEPEGIRYALRYWVGRFDQEIDCRDAVLKAVDAALRRSGTALPHRP
ncbi:mechanosensitive ion channel protein, partial [Cereibacter changlensis JA139]